MQRMFDFSGVSKVQESLKASLMARYDERQKSRLEDMDLDMVAAAAARQPKVDKIAADRLPR